VSTLADTAEIAGPLWCEPGLAVRGGRYPLSVETSVLGMVSILIPGVSTLTRVARFYALYWALAQYAADRDLDAATCRTVLRRSEVALAWSFLEHSPPAAAHGADRPHAVDRVRELLNEGATDGIDSAYSPRSWGFWAQYNGPSATLSTVDLANGAFRPGRRPCPPPVRELFRPLFDIAITRPVTAQDITLSSTLVFDHANAPEAPGLRTLMCAGCGDINQAEQWTGTDLTRRSTLRVLARAVQLAPDVDDWARTLTDVVAFSVTVTTDPVLATEEPALAWRGVLLRHYSMGAWRRLWSDLVMHARDRAGVTREDLYEWIMTMFTELHERNGRYFAEHLEGSANVGLRLDQLAALAQQVGVFDTTGATVAVTPAGRQALELPA
jgi:hypothetical protein